LLLQKDKKRRKWKGEKIRNIKEPKDLGHLICGPKTRKFGFCARLSKNVVKHNVSDKKGMLSHCKSVFE